MRDINSLADVEKAKKELLETHRKKMNDLLEKERKEKAEIAEIVLDYFEQNYTDTVHNKIVALMDVKKTPNRKKQKVLQWLKTLTKQTEQQTIEKPLETIKEESFLNQTNGLNFN